MNDTQIYLNSIGRVPLLTREEEELLARKWNETGDESAGKKLVESNLRFVVKVALGYRRHGIPLADLVQEGNLGLLQAVRNFDSTRGTRLITYAVWWIKAYIQASVLRSWSLVRVGTTQTQRRLFYRLPKANEELSNRGLTESERVQQLSKDLMARESEVRTMLQRMRAKDFRLDRPLSDEDESLTHMDRLVDTSSDPADLVEMLHDGDVLGNELHRALGSLSPRERHIIERRYLGASQVTLRDIGKDLKISRERVRQLESQALGRLKRILASRLGDDVLDVESAA